MHGPCEPKLRLFSGSQSQAESENIHNDVTKLVSDALHCKLEWQPQLQQFPADGENQKSYPGDSCLSPHQQTDEEMKNRVVIHQRGLHNREWLKFCGSYLDLGIWR